MDSKMKEIPIPPHILQFAQDRGSTVVQINGQRIFGSTDFINRDWTPPSGTEIYVGHIPRHMFEPTLLPVFELAGPVFQLRLMMDFSGTNKGFCFVRYFYPEQVHKAVQVLDLYEIQKNWRIVVRQSVDNCRLLLGGIPTYKTAKEIYDEIRFFEGGVHRVWKTWLPIQKISKGLVLVEYDNHRSAALARRKMLQCKLRLWGYSISVEWGEPDQCPYMSTEKYQILRVKNLPRRMWLTTLYDFFNQASYNGVCYIKRVKGSAFVYFLERCHADTAKLATHGVYFEGRQLSVGWAHPAHVPLSAREKIIIDQQLNSGEANTGSFVSCRRRSAFRPVQNNNQVHHPMPTEDLGPLNIFQDPIMYPVLTPPKRRHPPMFNIAANSTQ